MVSAMGAGDLITPLLTMAAAATIGTRFIPGLSEATFAALLAQGYGAPFLLFAVATVANTLTSFFNFLVGVLLASGTDLPKIHDALRRTGFSDLRRAKAEALFARYGAISLLFCWLPFVGGPIAVVAGLARYHWLPFVLWVGLGKGARYALVWAGLVSVQAALP